MHPELQAELQFGIEQSKDQTIASVMENLTAFLEQTKEWQKADNEIVGLRGGLTRRALPGTDDLEAAVGHEIDYEQSVWQGDYAAAFEACREVLARLNDDSLRGYRALWSYLAGSAAWLGFKGGIPGFDQQARTQYAAAQKAARRVAWLVGLCRVQEAPDAAPTRDEALALQVEKLEGVLEELGTTHDRKFNEELLFIGDNIMEADSKKFEPAHERLGTLLGFAAGKIESTGSPDPWWILSDGVCLVFEDYSNAEPSSCLGVTKARQVASHPNWMRENVPLSKSAHVIPVLVTPVSLVDKDAMPHLKEVCIWKIDEFRALAKTALLVIRELRRTFPGSGDLAWRAAAAERLQAAQLDPASITGLVISRSADRVVQVKT